MNILTILTNYKRPENLDVIIPAIQQQTVPTDIIVVDNSPPDSQPKEFEGVRDVWRMRENYGPPCRFAPALLEQKAKYILFYDDDALPGPQMIEHLLEVAKTLEDRFATIGELGRKFIGPPGSYHYNYHSIATVEQFPVPVDITIRGHLVLTSLLYHAIEFKWKLLRYDSNLETAVFRHDDFLMCLGIQAATGYGSYLSPKTIPERKMFMRELNSHDAACNTRGSHMNERQQIIRPSEIVGWKRTWKGSYLATPRRPPLKRR